ncbi:MAG TPA: mandelate racemase/muconate lactonizing enzyme family protein [Actinomycetota bacterium]|nr:mandelate racemase/muconate lactonizing enzyme family protein [Actinomycetota bacterium]
MTDRVARVELFHFVAPLPATFHPSWIPGFPQDENRATLIRVVTEDGVEGWSAGPAIGRERQGLGDLIGPYLIGEDATDIDVIQQRLREISYLGWRNWWIEPAFWDIKGKIENRPVYKLLDPSAEPRPVTVYASSGEVRDPKARIAEAMARYEEGFRTFKIRVHEDERADERQVAETARAVGDKMALGVDANQAWRVTAIADAPLWDLDRAKRFADVCADLGIAWIEEPLPMDAYEELAALSRYSRVPIAGGELHTGAYPELAMMVRRGCYLVFQPDACFTGGIGQTWRLIRLCASEGLGYTPHTWTNGVGFAINLQLYVASGTERPLEYPYDPPGWTPEGRDAMLEEPFLHDRGRVTVPEAPGLGIQISTKALKRYGRSFFKMDRKRLAFFAVRDRGLKAARAMDKAKKARLKD